MRTLVRQGSKCLVGLVFLTSTWAGAIAAPQPTRAGEEVLIAGCEIGRYGGALVTSLRSEPKTFNPVTAVDGPSKEILARLMGDLIHINRRTQQTEPALAKSWSVSGDGRVYTLHLRRGIRFSDGQPFDADDVLFTFQILLDENVHSPERDLLLVDGKPMTVSKLDSYTVVVELAKPYAAAERLFDSVFILPRHLLAKAYEDGKINQTWSLGTAPEQIAGLGPFRFARHAPGQYVRLERNPYYWKVDRGGQRLPYLDQVTFMLIPSGDAQAARFGAGELDVISRPSAQNFLALSRDQAARGFSLYDLGSSLEYNFLFFNLNDLPSRVSPSIAPKQAWFRNQAFRQAISTAIDREAIVRLVYRGRATPLWTHVTPSNKLWVSSAIARFPRSVPLARNVLRTAGFSWNSDGNLTDARGQAVEFSIIMSASNSERKEMATLIQDDLKQIGINVHVVPMEFQALVDRVFSSFDYEACILGLVSGDADPNPERNVWLWDGGTHLWDLHHSRPPSAWEAEIDHLMREQLTVLKYEDRKRMYDRVQEIVAQQLPLICLVSPNVLVGARRDLGNFDPAALGDYALWNSDQLFFRPNSRKNQ